MRCLLFNRQHFCQPENRRQSGFTLIELLLIIVLLGVLAVAAINAFEGNEDQGRLNITRLEMAELQKALLQFRRDNRELPCRVYRDGIYNPLLFEIDFSDGEFSGSYDLPGSYDAPNWHAWCLGRHPADVTNPEKASNALLMLNVFPYLPNAHATLFWDRNRQAGWNGPYISQEALVDGWGNRYRLLDPELDYNQTYYCKENGGSPNQLAIDSSAYDCQSVSDGMLPSDYTIPGNIARIASAGPDGLFQSVTSEYDLGSDGVDPCMPLPGSDDLILCLLR